MVMVALSFISKQKFVFFYLHDYEKLSLDHWYCNSLFSFVAVCGKRRLQTCRPQTCRFADLQTCRLANLQTCGLAETFGTHGEAGG